MLRYVSQKYLKKSIAGFAPQTEKILCSYDWPGNTRELRNMIERIVVLQNVETVLPQHLPAALVPRPFVERRKSTRFILPEKGISLEALSKDLIQQALVRTGNNQTKAAKLLDVSYDVLRYQIKKFELN